MALIKQAPVECVRQALKYFIYSPLEFYQGASLKNMNKEMLLLIYCTNNSPPNLRSRMMADSCKENHKSTFLRNSYASNACYAVRFANTAKAVAKRLRFVDFYCQ